MISRIGPLKRLRNLYRDPGRRKKLYVFLVCLFLSAFFWLFIKLSREAQAVIERPLVVSQVPSDVVISQQSHQRLQLTIQTTGARLLASSFLKTDDTLFVDAATFGRTNRSGELWHFVTAAQMRSSLAGQFDGGRSLTGIWPDTVFVKLAFASQKKVPVRLNASYTFDRRFGQYGELKLLPDSVVVRGPRQVVDTLQAIRTEPLVFENLSQTIEKNVVLQNPAFGYGLTLETQQAFLTIPVEEFTEKSVEVSLSVLCNHESGAVHNLRLFPNRVTVSCLVALKDYNRVEASLFVAHVVCPAQNTPESNRLEVIVEKYPDFVTIQSIRPASVEFLFME